jgi:hypothetical protein
MGYDISAKSCHRYCQLRFRPRQHPRAHLLRKDFIQLSRANCSDDDQGGYDRPWQSAA